MGFLKKPLIGQKKSDPVEADGEYAPLREKLTGAGLDEAALRRMDPDDRVAALETARLDPYDFIYLAC